MSPTTTASECESDAPLRPIPVTVPVQLDALVIPEPGGGYSAEVPALPGCFTCGDTLDEVLAKIREAAEGWLLAKADMLQRQAATATTTPSPLPTS